MAQKNADEGVTWVHSYVNEDHTRTFCVYDGPDPEAIRRAAKSPGGGTSVTRVRLAGFDYLSRMPVAIAW